MPQLFKGKAVVLACACLVAAMGWFYVWTAIPEWRTDLVQRDNLGYYNLLTRGFLKGRLSLDVVADPILATLKEPTNPAANRGHGMHDASYFHGKYYLYFGVAPAVLLFLPFRLITGLFVNETLAAVVFAAAGLVLSVWLVLAIRRRHFPGASAFVTTGCVLALGLADMVPDLLRRTSVWEVPISCGYACCMLGLVAVFQALHARRPVPWLVVAGAAFGLAVGSRPTYLLACLALLPALWHEARVRHMGIEPWRDSAWRHRAVAALLPLAVVGGGLAAYNTLRFGNPLDFGFRHVMAGGEDTAREQLFAWRFFWYNFRVYALAPARWTRYFPFVMVARLPPPPAGHLGVEDPYGILPNIPFVWLAAGWLTLLGRGRSADSGRLHAFGASLGVTAIGTGLMVCAFGGATNRYMVDFLPAWVILACVGLLAATTRPWYRGATRGLGNLLVGALVATSAMFNILASLRHNELFRAEHPALYRRIAHRCDWLSYAWDRWQKTRYGPVEMKVIFPTDRVGFAEPLVVTGCSFMSDYLFVHYDSADAVRFGLEHTSHGAFIGQPVPVAPGRPHLLRIDLGSLYPPAADPHFDAMSPNEARLRQDSVRVTLDGRVVLQRELTFYDAIGPVPSIGSSGDRPGFRQPFSGRILWWRRMPGAKLEPLQRLDGSFRLELTFPAFIGQRNEPLVCSGATGRGDLIYVRYDSPDHVSFGDDHWGTGGDVSTPLAFDPRAVQVVEIDYGALHPGPDADADPDSAPAGRGRLVVRLNGRTALDEPALYYPCDPGTVAAGLNAIQATTAEVSFTGSLVKVERLPVRAPRADQGPDPLRRRDDP